MGQSAKRSEGSMDIETQVTITLDKRQARLAEANSGLPITLPTLTQHIVLKIKREEEALEDPVRGG